MSVLMTAAAKKGGLRPKSAKSKQKKKSNRGEHVGGLFYGSGEMVAPPAPPTSDDRHSVWYWELDGEPMTVIFDKITRQVWCNGLEIDSLEGFGDDYVGGPVVQFGIYAQSTASLHQGCIRYTPSAPAVDQLFVNDCLIMEHAYRPYDAYDASSSVIGQDLCGAKLPPYANDELPSYEEAILQPLTYLQLEESKKYK